MKRAWIRSLGCLLVLLGLAITVFSEKIVFPGLEVLLGIERIVGRESVVYLPGGGYAFTNPGAMMRWICSVAAVGIIICFVGAWLLFRARKSYATGFNTATRNA